MLDAVKVKVAQDQESNSLLSCLANCNAQNRDTELQLRSSPFEKSVPVQQTRNFNIDSNSSVQLISKQEAKDHLPEIVIGSSALGATLGAGIGGGAWAMDKNYAKRPATERADLKWWEKHSAMLKNQEPFKEAVAQMEKTERNAAIELTRHRSGDYQLSKQLFNDLHTSIKNDLLTYTKDKAVVDATYKQLNYLETPLDAKNWNPSANIGTKAEVLSGEKIFDRRTTLGKLCQRYEEASILGSTNEAALPLRNEMSVRINDKLSKLGEKKSISAEDIELRAKQSKFLSLVEQDHTLAEKGIGYFGSHTQGWKVFDYGTDEAGVLKNYRSTMERHNQLIANLEKAKIDVDLAKLSLNAQIEKGAGSLLCRTLEGSVKGLLVAGSALATVYVLDKVGEICTQKSQGERVTARELWHRLCL